MNAALPPDLGLINGIPAKELLEGLGNLHQSVVVTSTEGSVLWASRALERVLGGSGRCVGLSLAALLTHYLEAETARDYAPTPSRRRCALAGQATEILDQLERNERLCHYRLEPEACDDHSAHLEINAFCVNSRAANAASADPPRTERLCVVIFRPAPKSQVDVQPRPDPGAFHQSVLDQLPEATLTIDQSGFITYANARTVSLLGRTPGELIDTPISLYFPSSAIVPMNAAPGAAARGTEQSVVEFAPAGRPAILLEVSSRMLDLPDGEGAGRILHLRDSTSQRRTTEQLEQKIAALESYAHTVSHDLRSPLVSMLGFTRLMRKDYEDILDETGKRFLDRIEQAGANMNTMTQDLLELSAREHPRATPDATDPLNVLLQVKAELKPRLEEHDVRLGLPPAPPMIQCGRTQLYQIFCNLIGNALQHMGPCKQPRIEVEIHGGPEQRIIAVRDNGRGIATDAHERIFDAFHSLSRDDGPQSTGVGLAIVKKIALAHEGRVWVESEPQHGATFFVTLKHR